MDGAGWPAGWREADAALARRLEAELRRELPPDHVLSGRACRALATNDDDDVLFSVENGPVPLAAVHLTWTGRREREKAFPFTRLHGSLEEWRRGQGREA